MIKVRKNPMQNPSTFLTRLATLLNEGYTFKDGVTLLLPHHLKDYESTLMQIDNDFRNGYGISKVLSRLGFSRGLLLPISLAETDGRLPYVLESISVRLQNTEQSKKKLKSLLTYPAILLLFIFALLISFRQYFIPNIEAISQSNRASENSIVTLIPLFVTRIPDLFILVSSVSILICLVIMYVYKKLSAEKRIQFITSLPLVNTYFSIWKTRLFASEIGYCLNAGLSMQDSLDILIVQKYDLVLSELSRNVKLHILHGDALYMAIHQTNGLTKQFSSFAKHGESSGHLSKELIIYSHYLEEEIERHIGLGLSLLQPILFSFIAICILAAYIALLLPVYDLVNYF